MVLFVLQNTRLRNASDRTEDVKLIAQRIKKTAITMSATVNCEAYNTVAGLVSS